MNVQQQHLIETFPDQLWLSFPSELRDKILKSAQKQAVNSWALQNSALNQLATQVFCTWLQEAEPNWKDIPFLLPEKKVEQVWQVCNGTALRLGSSRIILVPTDTIGGQEMIVPWEWIDIPEWAGQVFIAIQVDLEACLLGVRGWALWEDLKNQADHNRITRCDLLELSDLSEDLELLFPLIRQGCIPQVSMTPQSQTTFDLSPLLKTLAKPENLVPRLSPTVEFGQWAALVTDSVNLQKLIEGMRPPTSTCQLRNVVKGLVAPGWEKLILSPALDYAFTSRDDERERGQETTIAMNDNERKEYLHFVQTLEQLMQAPRHHELEQKLQLLVKTTTSNRVRWAAVDVLAQYAQTSGLLSSIVNPLEDLGIQVDGHPLDLRVNIVERSDSSLSLQIEVAPFNNRNPGRSHATLPENVTLRLLNSMGELIAPGIESVSRASGDARIRQYLNLKPNLQKTTRFMIEVSLGNSSVLHHFEV